METKYVEGFDSFDADESKNIPNPVEADAAWVTEYLESGKPFGIVSAYQSDVSPSGNAAAHYELKREITQSKYGYKEIAFRYSCFDGDSIVELTHRLLFIPDIPFHLLLRTGTKFGQQAVAVRGKSGLDFIRVSDEQLLLSIPSSNVPLAWSNLLLPPGATAGQQSMQSFAASKELAR